MKTMFATFSDQRRGSSRSLLLVLLGLCAGCSGEAQPPPASASLASTPTASPTVVPVAAPPEAPPTVSPAGDVTLSGPPEASFGTRIAVSWTGPDALGDYITLVAADKPDGQYGTYSPTQQGSPVYIKVPAQAGDFELRYMSKSADATDRVLGRRAIRVVP
jgi:hypothetical protein